jgi:hypothetical protein
VQRVGWVFGQWRELFVPGQTWGFFVYAPWDLNPEPADQERDQAGLGSYRIMAENAV